MSSRSKTKPNFLYKDYLLLYEGKQTGYDFWIQKGGDEKTHAGGYWGGESHASHPGFKNHANLFLLNVAPDKQRQGIGTELALVALRYFWEKGSKTFIAAVNKAGRALLKRLERRGFITKLSDPIEGKTNNYLFSINKPVYEHFKTGGFNYDILKTPAPKQTSTGKSKQWTIDFYITEENIEYKLFTNQAGTYSLRVYDEDAKEVVLVKQYTNREKAEQAYNELVNKARDKKANKAPALFGREITLSMPNGESRRAQFAIVELDDVLASHNEKTFASSNGYPLNNQGENINDRNYADDPAAQARVQEYAQKLDPYRIITTSRTPSGTPIVAGRQIAGKWIVVSGNNRTMSTRLAAADHPANYKKYVDVLCEEWGAFGFKEETKGAIPRGACNDKNEVVFLPTGDDWTFNQDQYQFKKPFLVRIDYDFPAFETQELAKYNQSTMKGKREVDKTIERSSILRENELCQTRIPLLLDPFDTMSDFYRDRNAQKEMLDMLIQCNIITEQSRPEYYEEGYFTDAGKNLIESVLAGVVLGKQALKAAERDGVKVVRKAVVYALPALMTNQALPEEARLIEHVNSAVLYQSDIVSSGLPFDQYINQGALFSERRYHPWAIYLNRLTNKGQRAFKSAILAYNQSLKSTGSTALFVDQIVTPAEAFEAYIIKAIPENEAKLIERFGSSEPEAKPQKKATKEEPKTPIIVGANAPLQKALREGNFSVIVPKNTRLDEIRLDKNVIVAGRNSAFQEILKAFKKTGLPFDNYKLLQVVDGNTKDRFAYRYDFYEDGFERSQEGDELPESPKRRPPEPTKSASARLRLTKAKLKIKLALLKL